MLFIHLVAWISLDYHWIFSFLHSFTWLSLDVFIYTFTCLVFIGSFSFIHSYVWFLLALFHLYTFFLVINGSFDSHYCFSCIIREIFCMVFNGSFYSHPRLLAFHWLIFLIHSYVWLSLGQLYSYLHLLAYHWVKGHKLGQLFKQYCRWSKDIFKGTDTKRKSDVFKKDGSS